MRQIIQHTSQNGKFPSRTNLRSLAIALCTVLLAVGTSGVAQAHQVKEKYVLNYNDVEIRSGRDYDAELFLKRTLYEQYPWVDVRTMDLRKVTLVAKSKHGGGSAQLRVGDRMSTPSQVGGSPRDFHNCRGYTFERVHFVNPDRDSRGPWQIDLRGNLIVRKVILEVDKHSYQPVPKFHGFYGWHDRR